MSKEDVHEPIKMEDFLQVALHMIHGTACMLCADAGRHIMWTCCNDVVAPAH